MKRRIRSGPGLLILAFYLLGCSTAAPAPTATPGETAAAPSIERTATLAASPSPTPPPTESSTPSPTSTLEPSPTETSTPTPVPLIAAILDDQTTITSGPAFNYAFLASLNAGYKLEIFGQNDTGDWLVVRLTPSILGWVPLEKLAVDADTAALAVIEAPPVPPPTGTPIPEPEMTFPRETYNAGTVYQVTLTCVALKGLKPGESWQIDIQVKNDEEVVDFSPWTGTADENGKMYQCGFRDVGEYTLRLTVSSGKVYFFYVTIATFN